ncbi:putative carboxypeptidase [Acaryochloris phage A-HIS1]|nr:putative carboxypeptidase [Acaryochloris phage A-HIS1]
MANRKVLDVPFLTQVDNDNSQWTKYWQECSFTCMAMILVFLRLAKKIVNGRQLEDVIADEYGTKYGDANRGTPHMMVEYFEEKYGVTDRFYPHGTVEQIKESIDDGLPVIVHTYLTGAGGHVVLIVGYDDAKGVWIVHDPWGEYHSVGYDNSVHEGKFEEYSYGLMTRLADDNGYWIHIIDVSHAETADNGPIIVEDTVKSSDVKNAFLIDYDGSNGDPMVFLDAVKRQSKKLGFGIERNRYRLAYIMATVEHECANTWKPIDEWHGGEMWYAPYFGRGYVQLTHKKNYQKYENILGLPLVSNPDLVKRPDISLFILVQGMFRGTFTGLRLGHFIGAERKNVSFVGARKIINGVDKAEHIANLAESWLEKI